MTKHYGFSIERFRFGVPGLFGVEGSGYRDYMVVCS